MVTESCVLCFLRRVHACSSSRIANLACRAVPCGRHSTGGICEALTAGGMCALQDDSEREKHLADNVRKLMIVDSVEADTKKADSLFEGADADK